MAPTAWCRRKAGKSKTEKRSRSKGPQSPRCRHSAITHQRSNRASNKAARSKASAGNARQPTENGNKAGNGKPVGSELKLGKEQQQACAQGVGQGKPARQTRPTGKAPTVPALPKPGAKPAIQGSKPAAKGAVPRPAR